VSGDAFILLAALAGALLIINGLFLAFGIAVASIAAGVLLVGAAYIIVTS
jgi:hypothetical protein